MIDYLATFVNTDAVAFPNTAAVNATGPSATDGTEFVKAMIDDEWGARQALMDYAGLIPDGLTEAPGTSQMVEAIGKAFIGPGEIVEWNLANDPATEGRRRLLLNGQGVLRASYPELDAAVYVGDIANPTASAYYRADDAAGTIKNIVGVYLILPDRRGYFARGLDVAASIDPDGASRDLGSIQLDALQGHWHELTGGDNNALVAGGAAAAFMRDIASGTTAVEWFAKLPITDGVNGVPRISSETIPINIATTYAIVY